MCAIKVDLGKHGKERLKNIGNEDLKGKVLVDPHSQPKASWTFLAEIWNLKDPSVVCEGSKNTTTTIKNNFQPCVHTAQIRQSAKVILDRQHVIQSDLTHLGESDSETSSVFEESKSAQNCDPQLLS